MVTSSTERRIIIISVKGTVKLKSLLPYVYVSDNDLDVIIIDVNLVYDYSNNNNNNNNNNLLVV